MLCLHSWWPRQCWSSQIKALSSPVFARPCYGNNLVLPPPGEELLTSVIFMICIDMFQILQHLYCIKLISVLMSFCSSPIEAPTPDDFTTCSSPTGLLPWTPQLTQFLKRELQTACPMLPPSSSKKPEGSSSPLSYNSKGVPKIRGGNEARIGDRPRWGISQIEEMKSMKTICLWKSGRLPLGEWTFYISPAKPALVT